nr:hypothetical protein [Tanacetum cinerariifolium]
PPPTTSVPTPQPPPPSTAGCLHHISTTDTTATSSPPPSPRHPSHQYKFRLDLGFIPYGGVCFGVLIAQEGIWLDS